jgi:hypothetical protein
VSAFTRADAKMQSIALGAGVHPAHVGPVLDHLAKSYVAARTSGRMSKSELEGLTDAHHAEHIRRIVAANPETHVHYKPPSPTGDNADHEGVPVPPPGKTFKPGKKNTATRAELRASGVRY